MRLEYNCDTRTSKSEVNITSQKDKMKVVKIQKRLKKLRVSIGLTQVEVAKATNISQANICKIENCVKGVSLSDYVKIMKAYGHNMFVSDRKGSYETI